MNKSFCISLLLLVLAAKIMAANSVVINAHVVDSISGEPVEYACISNQSHTFGFMTDSEGRFSLNANEIPTDSVIVSRIGYNARMFSPRDIPAIIYLEESPTTLQSVTVAPKKRKKLGSMFIPNAAQKAAFDLVSKVDVTHQHSHRCDSEAGRKFKFKHDSRINKVRVCLDRNDSICVVFSVYRKVDNEWVNIHDRPIVVDVPASKDWKNIVEVDVSEILEPQPKGEYMVGISKQCEGRFNMWAKQPVFEDGRQVEAVYIGNPMRQDEKYLLINQAFAGKQRLMPFFNRQNNDDLILAIQAAGISRGRNGFRKNKGGEKLAESEEDLLEHRTDGTDAFDTLYIGCEKFPVHTTTALNISGVL